GQTQIARQEQALYLRGALPDLQDLRVPEEPRDGEVLHEPIAAVDLNGLPSARGGGFARDELRHRRLRAMLAPQVLQPRGSVRGQPRGLNGDTHVRDLRLNELIRTDRRTECRA